MCKTDSLEKKKADLNVLKLYLIQGTHHTDQTLVVLMSIQVQALYVTGKRPSGREVQNTRLMRVDFEVGKHLQWNPMAKSFTELIWSLVIWWAKSNSISFILKEEAKQQIMYWFVVFVIPMM